jgi:hypothetical protein
LRLEEPAARIFFAAPLTSQLPPFGDTELDISASGAAWREKIAVQPVHRKLAGHSRKIAN